jgi:hypothetical protein
VSASGSNAIWLEADVYPGGRRDLNDHGYLHEVVFPLGGPARIVSYLYLPANPQSSLMKRRLNFQTISWFRDLYVRGLLNLEPKYQRRSVWTQEYKDNFIDTILLEYPSPSIFLYEEIDSNGRAKYNVVDGKQRLTTVFEFVEDRFPVSDVAGKESFRGRYFSHLEIDDKVNFWNYLFSVEYIPTNQEEIINDIFNRINRNVAKLTSQELRHARFSGDFIRTAEDLTEFMAARLPLNFPRFDAKSKRQMKDVELTAHLLLLIEEGPKGYSQDDLDKAFADRDMSWDSRQEIDSQFRETIDILDKTIRDSVYGTDLQRSRYHNQADFYSLFGAIASLYKEGRLPKPEKMAECLSAFVDIVGDEEQRLTNSDAKRYYEATRAASSDTGPRKDRIEIVRSIIQSEVHYSIKS